MENIGTIILFIVALKSITIGSSFNFVKWFKYGKNYWAWYSEKIIDAQYTPDWRSINQ